MSLSPTVPSGPPHPRITAEAVFFGPGGLRAGWGALVFVFLAVVTGRLLSWMLQPVFGHLMISSPKGMIVIECVLFASVLIPSAVMAAIERRPMRAYGLPIDQAFRKDFWAGASWGLALLVPVMACMTAVGTYRFGPLALTPGKALVYGALWAVGFLLVAFFEEYAFRGYLLYTLTRGLGFWPAAILTSLLFAYAHHGNPGETVMGLAEIVIIAVIFCLAVQRTGTLWWAVGIHMAYDWGESFLFSVPNSGTSFYGHLSNAKLQGNSWLSGGTVGPEASLFNLIGELALLGIVFWLYPKVKYPEYVKQEDFRPQTLDLSQEPKEPSGTDGIR